MTGRFSTTFLIFSVLLVFYLSLLTSYIFPAIYWHPVFHQSENRQVGEQSEAVSPDAKYSAVNEAKYPGINEAKYPGVTEAKYLSNNEAKYPAGLSEASKYLGGSEGKYLGGSEGKYQQYGEFPASYPSTTPHHPMAGVARYPGTSDYPVTALYDQPGYPVPANTVQDFQVNTANWSYARRRKIVLE